MATFVSRCNTWWLLGRLVVGRDACGDVLNGFSTCLSSSQCVAQHVPIAPHFVPYAFVQHFPLGTYA
jgi:hypothetical protein